MRPIDADKYKMELHAVRSVFSRTDSWENAVRTGLTRAINGLDSAPTIKTKEIKYFDEDDSVWKIGSVIVDE